MGFSAALARTFESNVPAWDDLVVRVGTPRPCAEDGRWLVYTVAVKTRAGVLKHAVERRFTEFFEVFQVVAARAEKLYVGEHPLPPIPPKEWFAALKSAEERSAFLKDRRKALEVFMNDVLNRPPLAKTSEFMGLLGLCGGGGYLGVVELTKDEALALASGEREDPLLHVGTDESASWDESSTSSGTPRAGHLAHYVPRAEQRYCETRRGALVHRKKQVDSAAASRQVLPLGRAYLVPLYSLSSPLEADATPLLLDGPYLPCPFLLLPGHAEAERWRRSILHAIDAACAPARRR